MGAQPKKKQTRKRRGGRWAHIATRQISVSECPRCHAAKLPHRVCPSCGYYNGREVVSTEEAT